MNGILYKIRIRGLKTREGTIPMSALREISDALAQGSERALRLSVEGASVKKGRIPAWLSKSLEFTITGITKGSTVLEIEAPTLAQSAPRQILQQNLWYTLPSPEDTAVSLLSKSVSDAVSEQLESEYFDRGVLIALRSFAPLLERHLDRIDVDSEARPQDNFRIGNQELTKIRRLEAETPEPRAVVVAGLFNLIEHAQKQFQLGLEDGPKIRGKVDTSLISEEDMRTLWGKKVTVKGLAHFTPSGRIRFIEAQIVRSFETGEELFENVPDLQPPLKLVESLKMKHEARSPLSEIWGQWPGEESIDDILSALKEQSKEV